MLKVISSVKDNLSYLEIMGEPGSVSYLTSTRTRPAFPRDLQEMIDLLSFKVQKNREALDDYILLGRLFRLKGEPKRALRLHQNLLARPTLSVRHQISLFCELGFDLLDLRIRDFGENYFLKSLTLQRQNISALMGLERAYELQNKFDKAVEILERLVRLGRPESVHLAYVLSEVALQYLEKGKVARARRMVEKALRSYEACPYAHLTLANVYTTAQRYERAILVLRSFLNRWPSHSFLALRRLEDVHYRMDNYSEYEETLRNCIRFSPDNFYIYYSLARHLRKKRKDKEALEYLRKSLELNPLYVNAVRDLIQMLAQGENAQRLTSKTNHFFASFKASRRFVCPTCRHRFVPVTWHCSKCGTWEMFEIRYELQAP